jgi:acyl dehydratase
VSTALIFFEDFEVGTTHTIGPYVLDAAEIREFAARFDPLPSHLEAATGAAAVSASGAHLMAIRTLLLHRLHGEHRPAIIAALGWDNVRFHRPALAGEALTLRVTFVEARLSRSRPGQGIVTSDVALLVESGELVLSHRDVILVATRPT